MSEGAGVVVGLLNARYYDGTRGQFVSQDPVFWGQQNLKDPQSLNSYSYANDNPITLKDPNGKQAVVFAPVIALAAIAAALNAISAIISSPSFQSANRQFVAQVGNVLNGIGNTLHSIGSSIVNGSGGSSGVVIQNQYTGSNQAQMINVGSTWAGPYNFYTPGGSFSPKTKEKIFEDNRTRHGGIDTCEKCGTQTAPGQKGEKGVSPPGNERQADHVVPKSGGGTNAPENGQELCRDCNLKKGATTEDYRN